jgi:hypothetical protein
LILSILPNGKNCVYLSDNGSISGVGKVDFFNRKQGKWIFRNPENGNISVIANFYNNKKNGELLTFYNNPYNKISDYYLFDNDSLDGVQKSFSLDGLEISADYYKNGEWYYSKLDPNRMCIDFIDKESQDDFYHESSIFDAIYSEEFDNPYDDEWNHKELGLYKQLSYCYVLDILRYEHSVLYYDLSDAQFIPEYDNAIYINNFSNITKIINYLLLLIILIINIIGLKKIKYDKL